MRTVHKCFLGGILLAALVAGGVAAQESGSDLAAVLSRIQALSHGSPSSAEWRGVLDRLDEIMSAAEQEGREKTVLRAGLLKARVLGRMRGDYEAALDILEALKKKYADGRMAEARRIYVEEAELYSRMGNGEAIRDLISEFRASRLYDGERYPYSGGKGREVPLKVVRPFEHGSSSLTVTAMEKCLRESRLAPGRPCPHFRVVDDSGRVVTDRDYAGRVLLLDFWLANWPAWRQRLPYQVEVYRLYHRRGFDILGICLDPHADGARRVLEMNGADWPEVYGERELPALFGVYGEAVNILVGADGRIIGRDLSGADLAEAVRAALAAR